MWMSRKKLSIPSAADALPGRTATMPVPEEHFVNGHPLKPPFPVGLETAIFGLGCFWGAERVFWQLPGVYTTAVGYAGGHTRNPSYEEVCSGMTGHTEALLVVYDPKQVSYDALLKAFWESHDPTQGMRQGNDVGTQYRSAIYARRPSRSAAPRRRAPHTSRRWSAPAAAPSPPKSARRRLSTTLRPITSNTSPRTPTAIAASAAPASAVPSGGGVGARANLPAP